jgi:hypothetical protein
VATASRTILVLAFVFVLGSAFVYRARFLLKSVVIATVVLLLVQSIGVPAELQSDPRVGFLMSRLGMGSDFVARTAAENLETRHAATTLAMDHIAGQLDPVYITFGRGYTTAGTIGSLINRDLATVDNTFVTLLYEEGVPGLLLFCGAFGVLLYDTRSESRRSLFWYAALALLGTGVSFDFESYSTFNVLAVASMALASVAATQESAQLRRGMIGLSSSMTDDPRRIPAPATAGLPLPMLTPPPPAAAATRPIHP